MDKISRAEYLQWCKDRALEYANDGDGSAAIASMMSDLSKHPETILSRATERTVLMPISFHQSDKQKVINWINDFN